MQDFDATKIIYKIGKILSTTTKRERIGKVPQVTMKVRDEEVWVPWLGNVFDTFFQGDNIHTHTHILKRFFRQVMN